MPWLKVDDGEWCAPWVMHVGPVAYGVYTRLAGYCAQALSDGLVPVEIAAMIEASARAAGDEQAIEKLIAVGRVERHALGDHLTGSLRLPYFLESNPSAAQVEADRAARSARGAKAAKARWEKS